MRSTECPSSLLFGCTVFAVVMYRRKKRHRSDDGSRVQGLAAGGDTQDQLQHHQATSLIQLNPISSAALANNTGVVLVHNPYYMLTEPTYCLTSISGIDRDCLEFRRQVHRALCHQYTVRFVRGLEGLNSALVEDDPLSTLTCDRK